MNFIKRAWFAVIRKPSRTIIMLIIFAAIANLVLTGFAIQHATEKASVLARQKLGGTLTLEFDMQSAMEQARSQNQGTTNSETGRMQFNITREPVTEAMAKTVAKQKNIIDYNIIVDTYAMAKDFSPVVTSTTSSASTASNQQNQFGGNDPFGGNNQTGQQQSATVPDVTVVGLNSTQAYDAFSNGATLVSGRHITEADKGKHVVMIEQNLATQDKLTVGKTITMTAQDSSTQIKYTIVGIYKAADTSPGIISPQGCGWRLL